MKRKQEKIYNIKIMLINELIKLEDLEVNQNNNHSLEIAQSLLLMQK